MDFKNLNNPVNREQRVSELAKSLFQRGLAMTMGGARDLAQSMVETEKRVQLKYEEKRKATTVFNDPRHNPTYDEHRKRGTKFYNQADEPLEQSVERAATLGELNKEYESSENAAVKKENAAAMRERALNPAPVQVQTEYDTPNLSSMSVAEATGLEQLKEEREEEADVEEVAEEPEAVEEAPNADVPLDSEEAEIESSDDPEIDDVEPKREDLGKKHKVDIGDIFNVHK